MLSPMRLLVATWWLLLAANAPAEVRAHTDADGYETFTRAGATTPLNAYKLHTELSTWDSANAACALEGAHLLVIDAVDEVRLARTLFQRVPPPGPKLVDQLHVGLLDKAKEGMWKTVLGTDLSATGNHVMWAAGQPDNGGGVENCGAITRDVTYNDLYCDKVHICPYICEKELASKDAEDVAIEEFIEDVHVRHGTVGVKEAKNMSRFLAIMFKLK